MNHSSVIMPMTRGNPCPAGLGRHADGRPAALPENFEKLRWKHFGTRTLPFSTRPPFPVALDQDREDDLLRHLPRPVQDHVAHVAGIVAEVLRLEQLLQLEHFIHYEFLVSFVANQAAHRR
jgi:hypothetical protein